MLPRDDRGGGFARALKSCIQAFEGSSHPAFFRGNRGRGMKILMAAMSMGLGGAETHILELSRALLERGHSVTVAGDGGIFGETVRRA